MDKFAVRLFTAACCACIVFSGCSKPGGVTKPPASVTAATPFATLAFAQGSVTMNGQTLAIGDQIPNGAVLATGSKSRAEILFNDKNIIRLGPKTILTVSRIGLARTLVVDQGVVAAVLRKLDTVTGETVSVRSASAVLGVRGTSFYVRVKPEIKETYFCTCNGHLALSKADGTDAFESSAPHHEANIFTSTDQGTVIGKPGPGFDFGHTDADVESLAAMIGEKMDWGTIEGDNGTY